jgi:hypothetical protein
MSATGLDVFDKTLQTTNIWLDEIMAKLGPDRQVAWHVLGAVLHALRDDLVAVRAVSPAAHDGPRPYRQRCSSAPPAAARRTSSASSSLTP